MCLKYLLPRPHRQQRRGVRVRGVLVVQLQTSSRKANRDDEEESLSLDLEPV